MHTWIYKGARKEYTYLYVTAKDDFNRVPKSLLKLLGDLNLVLDIELGIDRHLAQVDIEDVRLQLSREGYFLQLPPGDRKPEKVC